MRPTLVLLSLVLAGALALSGVSLASPSKRGPKADFVTGSGQQGGNASFHARKTRPAPTDVKGYFRAGGDLDGDGKTDFTLAGPITCLHVQGNRAGFFYPIEKSSNPAFEGTSGVFIWIADNERSSGDTPDELGFSGPLPLTQTASCPYVESQPIDRGNFVVRDGRNP